ncbi:MAG: four helix bundle protein [Paludibacteraceae bacterium]|nr:four helix bundle protein [Paludibacteraceae bacterium]
MATCSKFEDLKIWQEARILAKDIYQLTSVEPFSKDYRFCSQIRAAVGSIMDNIAEGFEKENNKEFIQFLFIAKGSCGEVRSQLHRAKDVDFIADEDYQKYIEQTLNLGTSISNFIKYLKNSDISGMRYL